MQAYLGIPISASSSLTTIKLSFSQSGLTEDLVHSYLDPHQQHDITPRDALHADCWLLHAGLVKTSSRVTSH